MIQLALIPCLALASGVESVAVPDPSFDQDITTWVLEGSVTPLDARMDSRGDTPDTSTGQCLALGPGESVRTCAAILPAIPGDSTLDINLSLSHHEAPGSKLRLELIDAEGKPRSAQVLVADQPWSRHRVSLPVIAGIGGRAFLRLERVGGAGGRVLVDNIAVENVGGSEKGFKQLFDGRTLEGWVGDTTGYEVVDGTIRCKPDGGGDLRSLDQYDDFILRFEFKLTAGGNNGIAVRAPVEGNAAYEGMEIQVIDNSAEQYESLKPWQFHGSAYGLAPAERGWMLPPGQWNREEIRLQGSKLRVTLNGHVILDADIDEAIAKGPPSGHAHPGASRTMGHIGFCGHGSDVAFREIRISPIEPPGETP